MSTSTAKSMALHLALVAMVLRAVLPDGWMPSAAPGTAFRICSVVQLADQTAQHKAIDRHARPVCPFSAVPVSSPPLAALTPHIVPLTWTRVRATRLAQRVLAPALSSAHGARAPPAELS